MKYLYCSFNRTIYEIILLYVFIIWSVVKRFQRLLFVRIVSGLILS